MFKIGRKAILFFAFFPAIAVLTTACSSDDSSGKIIANVEDGVDPTGFYMPPEWKTSVVHVVSANKRLKDRGIEIILESIQALSYQSFSQRQRYNFLIANASEPTKQIEAVRAVFYGGSSAPIHASEAVFSENGVETPKSLPPRTAARIDFSVEVLPDVPTHAAFWIKRVKEKDSYFIVVNLQGKGGYINLK